MHLLRPIRTVLPSAFALLLLVAASPGGCGHDAATAPVTGADTSLTLAPGAEAFPLGPVFGVTFLEVREDSRCPLGVMCIWAGNAVVRVGLRLGMGPTSPYDLNTTVDPTSVIFGGYRVTLVGLAPLPLLGTPVPAGDFRATLRVQRFGPD